MSCVNQLGSCKELAEGGAVRQQIVNVFFCLCSFGGKSTVSPLSWRYECPRGNGGVSQSVWKTCTWTLAGLQASIFPLVHPPCLHSMLNTSRRRLHFWGRDPDIRCEKKKSQDNSKLETAPSFFTSSWRSHHFSNLCIPHRTPVAAANLALRLQPPANSNAGLFFATCLTFSLLIGVGGHDLGGTPTLSVKSWSTIFWTNVVLACRFFVFLFPWWAASWR